MNQQRALKVVVVVVGLLFVAAVYPLGMTIRKEPAVAMMMSLYATLGVFLLMAARDPSAHRGLIGFTAWSSFAHATVMGFQALQNWIQRRELIGSLVFVIIGIVLVALLGQKQKAERGSAARA
jgi:hypothetical protein